MHLSSRLTLCLMASIVLGAGPQTGDAHASPTVEALRSNPEAERNRAEKIGTGGNGEQSGITHIHVYGGAPIRRV